jgi:hypothetical protein
MSDESIPPETEKLFAQLIARISRLEHHILTTPEAHQFVEHRGGLFKKHRDGGYHQSIFCYRCWLPLSQFNTNYFVHTHCDQSFDMGGQSLASIVRELPNNPPQEN